MRLRGKFSIGIYPGKHHCHNRDGDKYCRFCRIDRKSITGYHYYCCLFNENLERKPKGDGWNYITCRCDKCIESFKDNCV
jgi:hypothetical protein